MAEKLGDALLYLRTDDTGLEAGMRKAKAGAEGVGAAFDRTKTKSGQLSAELGKTGQAAAGAGVQFTKAGQQVIASAGAQRQGMIQLGAQLGDMATMYSLGARPMQIFASQIGQVTGAVQLMGGGMGKVAGFLSTGWGIAITTAAIVLVPLIGKLFEAEEAAKAAETGADALADAQSVLGNVFDLTTGKIKSQNEVLLLNARLTAINLRATALQKNASAQQTFAGAGSSAYSTLPARLYSGSFLDPNSKAYANNRQASQLASDIRSGKISRDDALKASEKLDYSGLRMTKQELQQAILDSAVAEMSTKAADLIDKSLDSGVLATELRQPGSNRKVRTPKTPKPPKDRTAEIADRQATELARLDREELQAKLDLTTDVQDRAAIQSDILNQERTERVRQIKTDKDLSEAQKAAQLAYIDRLYGKAQQSADGTITVEGGSSLYGQQLARELRERETALANDALARQAAALDAQAAITISLKDRDGLEKRSLDLQQQIEANLLEQDIANGRIADADTARALLAERQASQRQQMLLAQQGPMDRFRRQLSTTVANMDQEFEQVKVDGIQSLIDGIAEAGLNFEKLGATAKRVLAQILADMIRLQLMKFASSILGGLGGGVYPGVSASSVASLTPGVSSMMSSPEFSGLFATGGRIAPGEWGIVGENGPEPVIGTASGAMVLPHRRMGEVEDRGGNYTVNNAIYVPARADPRKTQSSVARGTQMSLARATRKGIAAPAGRSA